jgi:hypothetical protein
MACSAASTENLEIGLRQKWCLTASEVVLKRARVVLRGVGREHLAHPHLGTFVQGPLLSGPWMTGPPS